MPKTLDEMRSQISTCYRDQTKELSRSFDSAELMVDAVERACGIFSWHWELYDRAPDGRDNKFAYRRERRKESLMDAVVHKSGACKPAKASE